MNVIRSKSEKLSRHKLHIEIDNIMFSPDERKLIDRSTDSEQFIAQQACDVLNILIENNGELVKRETLIDKVWGENYLVGEQGLNRNISILRKALNENVHNPKILRTFPRKGYMLVGEIKKVNDKSATRFNPHKSISVRLTVLLAVVSLSVYFFKTEEKTRKDSNISFSTLLPYSEVLSNLNRINRFPQFNSDATVILYSSGDNIHSLNPYLYHTKNKNTKKIGSHTSYKNMWTREDNKFLSLKFAEGKERVSEFRPDKEPLNLFSYDELFVAEDILYSLDVNSQGDFVFPKLFNKGDKAASGLFFHNSNQQLYHIKETTQYLDSSPTWLNNNEIAFVGLNESGSGIDVYKYSIDSKLTTRITNAEYTWVPSISFDSSQNRLYSIHENRGKQIIVISDLDTSKQTTITDLPGELRELNGSNGMLSISFSKNELSLNKINLKNLEVESIYKIPYFLIDIVRKEGVFYLHMNNRGSSVTHFFDLKMRVLNKSIRSELPSSQTHPLWSENYFWLPKSFDKKHIYFRQNKEDIVAVDLSNYMVIQLSDYVDYKKSFFNINHAQKSSCSESVYVSGFTKKNESAIFHYDVVNDKENPTFVIPEGWNLQETKDCKSRFYTKATIRGLFEYSESGEKKLFDFATDDKDNWYVNEEAIFYVHREKNKDEIKKYTLKTGKNETIKTFPSGTINADCCLIVHDNAIYYVDESLNRTDIIYGQAAY